MRDSNQIMFLTEFIVSRARYFSNRAGDIEALPETDVPFFDDFKHFHEKIYGLFKTSTGDLFLPTAIGAKLEKLSDDQFADLHQEVIDLSFRYVAHQQNCKKIKDWLLDKDEWRFNWHFFTAPSKEPVMFKEFLMDLSRHHPKCRNEFEINNDRFLSSFISEAQELAYWEAIDRSPSDLFNFLAIAPQVATIFVFALPNLIELSYHFDVFIEKVQATESSSEEEAEEKETETAPPEMQLIRFFNQRERHLKNVLNTEQAITERPLTPPP